MDHPAGRVVRLHVVAVPKGALKEFLAHGIENDVVLRANRAAALPAHEAAGLSDEEHAYGHVRARLGRARRIHEREAAVVRLKRILPGHRDVAGAVGFGREAAAAGVIIEVAIHPAELGRHPWRSRRQTVAIGRRRATVGRRSAIGRASVRGHPAIACDSTIGAAAGIRGPSAVRRCPAVAVRAAVRGRNDGAGPRRIRSAVQETQADRDRCSHRKTAHVGLAGRRPARTVGMRMRRHLPSGACFPAGQASAARTPKGWGHPASATR